MYHPAVQPAGKKSLQAPCRRTASQPPDQLKQPRMAQQEEQSAQHGEAEPTQPRGEQPAQEPPTQPAQPEKGRHQDMRAIQMGGARTLYCHNTQPAECGQGREVCVEQTTDQEGDQPAYRAIMATDQPMSSGEGLTAHYPQTQRELQPVLGGFTAKGSQDGIGVSSCGTPGRPQDDTSPREADAKPRKADRQTIPPPNQLREQPELYCLRTCDRRDREDDNHWPQSFHPDPKLGSRGPDKTSSITVEKGLPFGKCGASQADPRTDNRITLASSGVEETTTANSQQITLMSQGGAGVERVPTERSTGTTTQSAPLPAVNRMDQPVGKQMLRNPSGGQTAFPGRETEARYPDICHTLASPPGGISGVSGGPAARYGDGGQNAPPIAASAIGAVEEVKPHSLIQPAQEPGAQGEIHFVLTTTTENDSPNKRVPSREEQDRTIITHDETRRREEARDRCSGHGGEGVNHNMGVCIHNTSALDWRMHPGPTIGEGDSLSKAER